MDYKRGDVWFADLGNQGIGSEQNGTRPVLVIQNDVGNRFSPTVIVACITSKTIKAQIPTHVRWEDNLILCEQIKTIDKTRLINKIAELSRPTMDAVNRAIKISVEI